MIPELSSFAQNLPLLKITLLPSADHVLLSSTAKMTINQPKLVNSLNWLAGSPPEGSKFHLLT